MEGKRGKSFDPVHALSIAIGTTGIVIGLSCLGILKVANIEITKPEKRIQALVESNAKLERRNAELTRRIGELENNTDGPAVVCENSPDGRGSCVISSRPEGSDGSSTINMQFVSRNFIEEMRRLKGGPCWPKNRLEVVERQFTL